MAMRKSRQPHGAEWQLQEAKNRLSQLVEEARHGQPQTITLRGEPAAVVVSFDQYQELTRPKTLLSQFFRESPMHGVNLELERDRDAGREVDL